MSTGYLFSLNVLKFERTGGKLICPLTLRRRGIKMKIYEIAILYLNITDVNS
jgi:hypothetical protein